MSLRHRFTKADQDELGLFLATRAGNRSGNTIYQQFAETHTNHPWQAWRDHYRHNTPLMNAVIRRKRRESLAQIDQQPGVNDQNDKDGSESPTEEIVVISQRTPKTRKGKEKATASVVEIDSDSDSLDSVGNEPSSSTLKEFVLHRIPNDRQDPSKTGECVTDQAFSSQIGKIHPNSSVQLITMSREEEQKFLDFISAYPEGDFRRSSTLYEKYHLQAPNFSAEEYRTYYLAHRQKLHHKRPASRDPEEIARAKVTKLDPLSVNGARLPLHPASSSIGLDDQTTLVVNDRENEVAKESIDDTAQECDTLSVSTGSSDDLELDYILTCPDHSEVARDLNISRELFCSLLKLQEDVFQPLDLDGSAPAQDSRPVTSEQSHPSLSVMQDVHESIPIIAEKVQDSSSSIEQEPQSPPVIQERLQESRLLVSPQSRLVTKDVRETIPIIAEKVQDSSSSIEREPESPPVIQEHVQESQHLASPQSHPVTQDAHESIPIISEKVQDSSSIEHEPESPLVTQEHLQGSRLLVPEPSQAKSLLAINEQEETSASTLTKTSSTPTKNSVSTSGKTSRSSSFKPAQPPTSVQEALDLLAVFLDDFAGYYSPAEAVQLFHQCGDWALMFEVATLKRLEQELQDGSNTQDDLSESAIDVDYKLRIQALVWTPDEDRLILQSDPPQEKLRELLDKKGQQAIDNRKVFLLSSD